jgi:hypothetical protein
MPLPETCLLSVRDTHRLIPAKYSDEGVSVLSRIADDQNHLEDIFELDHATNDRLLGENDLLPGISLGELVMGVQHYRIINAAFCHPHPEGSRFNGPDRGAWYAGFEVETSLAEIQHHRRLQYLEIAWAEPDEVAYDDYLANFDAEFHDLRNAPAFENCLAPDSYAASQALAGMLLETGSAGIVSPSVRRPKGTCLACFRPALVNHVRKGAGFLFTWDGKELTATPAK